MFKNFENFFFWGLQIKCWLSGLDVIKCSGKQTGKTLVRLLLQKKSDLGLHCLSMTFCGQLAFKFSNILPYYNYMYT